MIWLGLTGSQPRARVGRLEQMCLFSNISPLLELPMTAMRNIVLAIALIAVVSVGDVSAQVFGPQILWGDDTDFGIGGRVETSVGPALTASGPLSEALLVTSFDYFFPDCDTGVGGSDCSVTYWELHADLAIPLPARSI